MEDQIATLQHWLVFGGLLASVIILILYVNVTALKKDNLKKENTLKEHFLLFKNQRLEAEKKDAENKLAAKNWALTELEKYKQNELSSMKITLEANANEWARLLLEEWIEKNEIRIRQDAISRSYAVNMGKITEHLLPFHIKFPFNPKDVRFIGSPIDIIVFDGYADGLESINVYFLEVKTGNSRLSGIQQKIKLAVLNNRVHWREITPDTL